MNKQFQTKILAYVWVVVGLIYSIWGLFWFIQYLRPGIMWLTEIPNTHLIKDISFGVLFSLFGISLLRNYNRYEKLIYLISCVVLLYTAIIAIQELATFGSLYNYIYLLDLFIILLQRLTYNHLKAILIESQQDSNFKLTKKDLVLNLLLWVIIPFAMSLIIDKLLLLEYCDN